MPALSLYEVASFCIATGKLQVFLGHPSCKRIQKNFVSALKTFGLSCKHFESLHVICELFSFSQQTYIFWPMGAGVLKPVMLGFFFCLGVFSGSPNGSRVV